MNKEFRLPDVGEGLTEADIIAWHVKPGDTVTINQIIVEIETAKAVVELPSPYAGTVRALLVNEGQTVDVGTPIIAVDVGSEEGAVPAQGPGPEAQPPEAQPTQAQPTQAQPTQAQPTQAQPTQAPAHEAPAPEAGAAAESGEPQREPAQPAEPANPQREPVLVGYGVKPGSTKRRPRKQPPARPASYPATQSPPGPGPDAPSTAGPAGGNGGTDTSPLRRGGLGGIVPPEASKAGRATRALAKPPVRKLARDLGVDLGGLAGSGPEGSVTRHDVEQAASEARDRSVAAEQVSAAGPQAVAGPGQRGPAALEERIPVRGVRKHTAAAMVSSAFTAPHVTEFLQVDVTETMAAVRRARELPEFDGVKVSPLLFVAKALLLAARRHPVINSTWDEAAQEIVVKHAVNLGIAVAAERGLLVPNVKGADALPLADLARALDTLAATARAGKTTPADLAGGTITITNVGVFGVDAGTPILTPGEAAILAFGQVRDLPWVVAGELAVRKVTTLSLSFDHRIVDGELGSAVLRDVGSMLEDPVRMLAWS